MIKLTKKTEYALLALRFMGEAGPASVTSVKDLAARYGIPEMILAKVLQALKRAGIADSVKGAGGGYRLARPLPSIRVTEVLALFGEPMALVECVEGATACDQEVLCDIRGPMEALAQAFHDLLSRMTVAELFFGTRTQTSRLSIFR